MEIVGKTAQTGAALWILNVWFNRFNKDTGYRGGEATNMVEEFEEYGLSKNTMYVVGATKVSLASLMLIGHGFPKLVRPASIGLARNSTTRRTFTTPKDPAGTMSLGVS